MGTGTTAQAPDVSQINLHIWEHGLREVTQNKCPETKKREKILLQNYAKENYFIIQMSDVRVNGVTK